MEIKPLNTAAAYQAALAEISALIDLDPELKTAEGDRLDVLTTLVQAYEAKHFPI
jgi:HTH-type transcriptional regulator/antitoxin HigA